MKRILHRNIAAIALGAVVLFSAFKITSDAKTAEVQQNNGLYVFVDSTPIEAHEIIGNTSPADIVMDNNYKYMMKMWVNRTRKQFPQANGIIIRNDMNLCQAIKFKEQ